MADLTMSKYYFENDFADFEPLFATGPTVLKRYWPGDVICAQGETLSHGYYIKSGIMQLKIGTSVGKEKTLAFFGPGSVFPLGINEHHYRMEYAMTETAFRDVVAYQFTYTDLRRMVQRSPELASRIIEHYCDFTSFLFYEIASASYSHSLVKIANVLLALGDKVFADGTIELGQEQLAEVAGVSKIQVARAYKELLSHGVIATSRQGVRIVDQAALLGYCDVDAIG